MEGDVIITQDIFTYEHSFDQNSKSRFSATGIKPHCCNKIVDNGIGIRDDWFS